MIGKSCPYIKMYSEVVRFHFEIHGGIIACPSEAMELHIIPRIACGIYFIRPQKERGIVRKLLRVSVDRYSDIFTHV